MVRWLSAETLWPDIWHRFPEAVDSGNRKPLISTNVMVSCRNVNNKLRMFKKSIHISLCHRHEFLCNWIAVFPNWEPLGCLSGIEHQPCSVPLVIKYTASTPFTKAPQHVVKLRISIGRQIRSTPNMQQITQESFYPKFDCEVLSLIQGKVLGRMKFLFIFLSQTAATFLGWSLGCARGFTAVECLRGVAVVNPTSIFLACCSWSYCYIFFRFRMTLPHNVLFIKSPR